MIDDRLLKTLADIGFMASAHRSSKTRFLVFLMVLKQLVLTARLNTIGFALEFMNRKRHQEAIDLLHKEGLKQFPDDPSIKAFLGMALMFEGRNKESEGFLTPLLQSSDQESSIMAKELLGQIHGQ